MIDIPADTDLYVKLEIFEQSTTDDDSQGNAVSSGCEQRLEFYDDSHSDSDTDSVCFHGQQWFRKTCFNQTQSYRMRFVNEDADKRFLFSVGLYGKTQYHRTAWRLPTTVIYLSLSYDLSH